MSKVLKGTFDVHIDSNHRWDTDRVLEVDAYPMERDENNIDSTDTSEVIASVQIAALDYCEDIWIDTRDKESLEALPKHVRAAFSAAVALATIMQRGGHA